MNPEYVDIEGRRMAYRRAGDGPAIVLLHGFLCDSRCWRTQLEGLADTFTVIAWDALGAGGSSDPPDGFTIEDWTASLRSFLDSLDIETATLCGLSWGGMLAQVFAAKHPDRLDALVLADTYAGWKGSLPPDAVKMRLDRCMRDSMLPGKKLAAQWVPEFFTEHASAALMEEMFRIVSDFHPVGFRLMATALAETDTTVILGSIDTPTLLLWGDDDRRSPLDVAEKIHKGIAGSEIAVIADAGHLSNMEQPGSFDAHVRRFCDGSR